MFFFQPAQQTRTAIHGVINTAVSHRAGVCEEYGKNGRGRSWIDNSLDRDEGPEIKQVAATGRSSGCGDSPNNAHSIESGAVSPIIHVLTTTPRLCA